MNKPIINSNYLIVARTLVTDDCAVVLGVNMSNSAAKFATWNENPQRENYYYWGHYLNNYEEASADFSERVFSIISRHGTVLSDTRIMLSKDIAKNLYQSNCCTVFSRFDDGSEKICEDASDFTYGNKFFTIRANNSIAELTCPFNPALINGLPPYVYGIRGNDVVKYNRYGYGTLPVDASDIDKDLKVAADKLNDMLGVTPLQREAFMNGVNYGWGNAKSNPDYIAKHRNQLER